MKLLQNTKFTGPALLLLLLLNTTLLVLLLFRPSSTAQSPAPPPGPPGRTREFLVHELNMDKKQQSQYDTLIAGHQRDMRPLQENIRVHREAMARELQHSSVDMGTVNAHADSIGKAQSEIEKTNFNHFRDVRALCTPQQQPKFDSIILEALRMMGPPPGPHGPPPGPPGIHPPGPPPGDHPPGPPPGDQPPGPPPGN